MAIPEPVENEFRTKGTQKSDRELYLQKQIDTLKEQLNSQLDKTKALKSTFQNQMDKMREVNNKLQEEIMSVVQKHDDRLIKYMDLSDQFDALEAKYNELRGVELPEQAEVPNEEGGEDGTAEVLAEGES